MALREFAAFDNEAFTFVGGSSALTPGSAIINNSSTPVGSIFTFSSGFPYQTISVEDSSSDVDTFDDDDEENHIIVDGRGLVPDGAEVESESYHYFRQLDDNGRPFGDTITVTVFSAGGVTSNVWGMASDTELVDGARYVKTGGSNNGDSLYESFVPCFTSGTTIMTGLGLKPVERIRPGDMVMTRDNGLREVAWAGRRDLTELDLARDPRLRPVLIRAGALGEGSPARDMYVSPNHRVLLSGARMAMLFGEREVLVAAKHLLGRPGIERAPRAGVSYLHLLFDAHEVLFSDGMWTESFFPGDTALAGLGVAQSREIATLFPELRTDCPESRFKGVRAFLNRSEGLVARASA